jgi:Holliday junction resolvase RusA-like endonuclease
MIETPPAAVVAIQTIGLEISLVVEDERAIGNENSDAMTAERKATKRDLDDAQKNCNIVQKMNRRYIKIEFIIFSYTPNC